MKTKTCTKCNIVKEKNLFGKSTNKRAKDGLNWWCKSCLNDYSKAWTKANKEKRRKTEARYRKKYPEKYKEKTRRAQPRRKVRRLQREYGIIPEQLEKLKQSQKHVCAICLIPLGSGRVVAIDHDHATKKVRGILCNSCNRAIGWLLDSPENARRAAIYLENPPAFKLLYEESVV